MDDRYLPGFFKAYDSIRAHGHRTETPEADGDPRPSQALIKNDDPRLPTESQQRVPEDRGFAGMAAHRPSVASLVGGGLGAAAHLATVGVVTANEITAGARAGASSAVLAELAPGIAGYTSLRLGGMVGELTGISTGARIGEAVGGPAGAVLGGTLAAAGAGAFLASQAAPAAHALDEAIVQPVTRFFTPVAQDKSNAGVRWGSKGLFGLGPW